MYAYMLMDYVCFSSEKNYMIQLEYQTILLYQITFNNKTMSCIL